MKEKRVFEGVYVYAAPFYDSEEAIETTTGTEIKFYSPPLLTEQAAREMVESLMKKLDALEKKVDKISKKKPTKKRKRVVK
jgi:hypothetical protein